MAISGHQRPSAAISGHQQSSVAISGHQQSSAAISHWQLAHCSSNGEDDGGVECDDATSGEESRHTDGFIGDDDHLESSECSSATERIGGGEIGGQG